jgi:hypothetical protein
MSTSSTMSNIKNVFSKYKSYFIFYITDLLKNRVDVDKDLIEHYGFINNLFKENTRY